MSRRKETGVEGGGVDAGRLKFLARDRAFDQSETLKCLNNVLNENRNSSYFREKITNKGFQVPDL